MSLSADLKSTVEAVRAAVPAPIFAAIGAAISDLAASGIADRAARTGSTVPLRVLPDLDRNAVDLQRLADKGPLVVIFYRGGWCPYCNVTLRAFQRVLPQIAAAGASLVAITPEVADRASDTALKNNLGFPVLIDARNSYARSLGLVFALPESLRPQYRQIGIDLPDWNGDDRHELPLAATYVVDATGTVRWSFVEADFTTRAEPVDVLSALGRLS